MTQQIHARFRLDQINRARNFYKEPGAQESMAVESAHVQLNALQGEPFGSATPMGHLEMVIVNPKAAQVFFDAPVGQEFDILMIAIPKVAEPHEKA